MDSKNSQYLEKSDLMEASTGLSVNVQDLISADSYDETKLLQKFNSYDDNKKLLLFRAAVQIAIVGAGNHNYGAIRDANGNVKNLTEIFSECGVHHNMKVNEKYKDDDFSVRRLTRFFRFQISEFIKRNSRPSYLWRKYSDHNPDFAHICFPGAEHLVETKQEVEYLMNVYKNLDGKLNTNFIIRLQRVFIARGLMNII